jgi:membrane protease YdiL (CAAX protease family)
MLSDSLLMALGGVANVLFLLVAIYIYSALIRQISARTSISTDEATRTFGLAEAIVAVALISLLLLGVAASFSHPSFQISTHDLVENLLFILGVVFVIVSLLRFRGLDLNLLGGFSRLSFPRALSTGIILLLAAYPLIALGDAIAQRFFGGGSSKQNIVELFNASQTINQRIMIIVFAVAIAPVTEEFLFRFFLYGVLKRYFGRFFGIVANALLFAAVHTHLPSFLPLFVLGSCFTIAYEWSGSILVPMTMHALFNSLSLALLAFPDRFPQ